MVIEFAISLRIVVLPAFGGETINPLCPFPIGAIKSIILEEFFQAFHPFQVLISHLETEVLIY